MKKEVQIYSLLLAIFSPEYLRIDALLSQSEHRYKKHQKDLFCGSFL